MHRGQPAAHLNFYRRQRPQDCGRAGLHGRRAKLFSLLTCHDLRYVGRWSLDAACDAIPHFGSRLVRKRRFHC